MLFWVLYLFVAVLAWALQAPLLGLAAVGIVALRWVLPNPLERRRASRRIRELIERATHHPGDLLVRRKLAELYMMRGRHVRATALLEEAIAKGLNDAEVYYLLGLSRLECGNPEGALAPIVKSVTLDERLLLGDPYFTAARALAKLSRWDEAEDALDRGLAVNSSRVDGHVLLGQVRMARGNASGALESYRNAVTTWRSLPGYLQQRSFGSYLIARWRVARKAKPGS